MPLIRFDEHPAPGYYEDGSMVVVGGRAVGRVKPHKKSATANTATADCTGSGGGFGMGGGGSGGNGGAGAGGIFTGGGSLSYGGSGISGSSAIVDRYNPVRDRLDEGSIVEDWIPRDASGLDEMFKLMYHRDYIAGTLVDLLADMIWSEFDLVGIKDPVIRNIYMDSISSVDPVSTMPDITREFLVLGRTISSFIFDKDRGIIKDLVSHDPSLVRLSPIPIKGFDPKIDLIPSPAMRAFVESNDPRDVDARKLLPEAYIRAVRMSSGSSISFSNTNMTLGPQVGGTGTVGAIPLDPINTLFVARRRFNFDYIGTSLFTRLITFWALEKALVNATMASARRRSRSILHIKLGIDNVWEPTAEQMDAIGGMFIQADEDPVGAVVTTRTGVDTNEVRQGQDFYKWADEWTLLNEGKLRALGANDALLCLRGDTLVPTKDRGIIRIDSFGNEVANISLAVPGRNGMDITRKWLYSGHGEVMEIGTRHGNTLRCTPGHKILVHEDGDFVWREARSLRLDDQLCCSLQKCTRTSPMELSLRPASHKLHYVPAMPRHMTPNLAYLVGIIAGGTIKNNQVIIFNTNVAVLNSAKERTHHVFGEGVSAVIRQVRARDTYEYEFSICNSVVLGWLAELGITFNDRREVPWSILQADEESQLAYLAAAIDTDGAVSVGGREVSIHYDSVTILEQTQILLQSHGVDSVVNHAKLCISAELGGQLCDKLVRYSTSGIVQSLCELPDPDTKCNGEFVYTKVTSIAKLGGEEAADVYDIQMSTDPSFVANGIVVHNSGDATYSNQESARSFFMERSAHLRDQLTDRIFYKKMFPLLARIHGFTKTTEAQLAHGIRVKASKSQRESLDIPVSDLIIPTIQWRKELVSGIDQSLLDVYDRVAEKGVPIHLRQWAAASNIDLDNQMLDLDADADLRKRVNAWRDSYENQGQNEMQEAKLEFINSLRALSHNNLQRVVTSAVRDLGAVSHFVFWNKDARVGRLAASELAPVMKDILTSSDNSFKVLGDSFALTVKLRHSFAGDIVKADVSHYLMWRTGLTPVKPSMSGESVSELTKAVQAALDQYASNGNVYQLAKVAESELAAVASCLYRPETAAVLDEKLRKVDKTLGNRVTKDSIPQNSAKLFSGM